MKRHDGRRVAELRPLAVTRGIYEYALGSVLLELGKTKVLCAVTVQPCVPPFLRGQSMGWLTAEYALLPASTITRTGREISQMKRQGRSVEISRLISRSLRTIVDLSVLPDRTIMVDCDVLQADGGTRIASINGAYIALLMAQERLLHEGTIEKPFLKDSIAAVSIGVLADGNLVLDPDYKEDSEGIADINVIMTINGKLIELQGGAEKEPISWDLMPQIGVLAKEGIEQLQNYVLSMQNNKILKIEKKQERIPLFSLMNRQLKQSSL
jgi:ribonuclease PH